MTPKPLDLEEVHIDSMEYPVKLKAYKSNSLPEGRHPYRRESKILRLKNSVKNGFQGSLRR
ncbi:unnamed protein product [Cylicostephanus goldi]|uniref:Uncharacterized protein n=1 Tax=Cylicostephanus goldi TaxID=71465 RepID=A0A3P6SS46_CYLGO|nr:unnamed protein product [Cylicostephanus goldi]